MLIEITTIYDEGQRSVVLEKPCPFSMGYNGNVVAKANGAWCTLKCGYRVGYDPLTKVLKCDYDGEFGKNKGSFMVSIWGKI